MRVDLQGGAEDQKPHRTLADDIVQNCCNQKPLLVVCDHPGCLTIDVEQALRATEMAIFQVTGDHLGEAARVVFRGSWNHLGYAQIARQASYSASYLRQDIGPKLWKSLTVTFAIKVTKKNCRLVLEQLLMPEIAHSLTPVVHCITLGARQSVVIEIRYTSPGAGY
ncbi:MAG: hypothetical protein H7Y22_08715 [Gemmatimonadaceae bacterium]|nr:hypothetical protein [Gloeobacterales cyanobacterium ES-bin-141]